jgi:hypothetical protein
VVVKNFWRGLVNKCVELGVKLTSLFICLQNKTTVSPVLHFLGYY